MSHNTTTGRRHGRALVLAVALSAAAPLAACGGDTADGSDAGRTTSAVSAADAPAFGLVSPGDAAVLAEDPEITVVDVRTPEEFADGHVDGAVLIDFYDDDFAEQLAELDPDGTYLLYCRSGNRSGQATAIMTELGYDRVYDLDGGVIAWDGQGQALVR